MVYADLHVHTDNSDGALSLSAVPEAARRAGVSVVGVTDHDRLHPGLQEPVTERDGVTIVHGIELRVETPAQRIDLLAYGVQPTPALTAEIERLQRDRVERGRKIRDCIEDRLGVRLDVALVEGVGRPHLARAVATHPETAYETADEVFDGLIGGDDPCFVARRVPDFETGVDLLGEASAFVGLAHPLRYPDPTAALEVCSDLDAVERFYPYGGSIGFDSAVGVDTVEQYAADYDLLRTGGSDAHDEHLGKTGLSRAAYADVESALLPGS